MTDKLSKETKQKILNEFLDELELKCIMIETVGVNIDFLKCSNCESELWGISYQFCKYNYCPYCGSKIKEFKLKQLENEGLK